MFFTLKNQIILLFFTFESKKVHVVMNSLNLIPQRLTSDLMVPIPHRIAAFS